MRKQCISDEFAGTCPCQDHIKIIARDHLVDKLFEFIFVLSYLTACLLPCCGLLINLSQCKC